MPQVTVYIRKEDMDLWRLTDKKSSFMHDALNTMAVASVQYSDEPSKAAQERAAKLSSAIQAAAESSHPPKVYALCKHDQVKGFCKKGCK